MPRARALTNHQVAEAHVLYATGTTLAHLATTYSVSRATITRALQRAGATLRPRGGNHHRGGHRA